MIVKMLKAYVVAKESDRDALLRKLQSLGVMHITPVDPEEAIVEEQVAHRLSTCNRAVRYLSTIEPEGPEAKLPPMKAAEEAVTLYQRSIDLRNRLGLLHRQIDELEVWGDVRIEDFEVLRDAGLETRFYRLPEEQAHQVHAECVQQIRELSGGNVLVAVALREGDEIEIPEDAEELPLPSTDRPTVRAEAKEIDQTLRRNNERLAELAYELQAIEKECIKLQQQADYSYAQHSALKDSGLFAIQGWVPHDEGKQIPAELHAEEIEAAVQLMEPREDEVPPTLVRYPAWASPIKALFDVLGTVPGYREFDLSGFFMIALPIFAAMLIGDAGYGFVLTLAALLLRGKIVKSMGKPGANLLLIFGLVTIAWGVLTANYFGLSPERAAFYAGYIGEDGTGAVRQLINEGEGAWAAFGRVSFSLGTLYRTDPQQAQNIVIMISFVLGTVHLVSAQLRQAVAVYPDARFVSNIGWISFLFGMLGIVWLLFFENQWMPEWVMLSSLALGAVLIIFFSHPSLNPLKWLVGLASNVLPMIGAFSDTMSYIRLMAVGMASYYIAFSFNLLAGMIAEGSHWGVAIPILIFGHSLNMALAAIAIFAHGVRLNMLEFSNNAGVTWEGYAYTPFANYKK
ncbi:MAG: V-type ATP synthase subunit I [Phycisphaerae bacterium]